MNTIWHPAFLSGVPIVVKEEPDDDHHTPPAVNVEPPADDHGDDEVMEDLAGKITTIWRPNVRVSLRVTLRESPREVEDTERGGEDATKKGVKRKRAPPTKGEDATKKGVKRKRAPPTKGPCEHGVKYRSQCKVCGACPHGRQRSYCCLLYTSPSPRD